jgi:undecaprenyl-diphosphatase
MEIYQAIILGMVQGLTELLPISSSAHLNLIPIIFDWNVPESFDVALHFGTLLAIGIFFFKDWIDLIIGGAKKVFKKEDSVNGRMFWYIVAATIPGGAIGFILDKYAEEFLSKPLIIAIALIVMGIILYLVDKKSSTKTEYEEMTFKQTFLIGLSQALAFIPGVSRSGVTMTAGRAMGVSRESSAKYSFMLSAPIVLAATVFKLGDFIEYLSIASMTGVIAFVLGVLVSFVVGIIVIKFLLEYLKKGSFKIFAIYRVIIGLLVIAWLIFKV